MTVIGSIALLSAQVALGSVLKPLIVTPTMV